MSNVDLNRVQNLSYYSSMSNENKAVNKSFKKQSIQDYKLDGAAIILYQLKNQFRKNFKHLVEFYRSGRRIKDLRGGTLNAMRNSYTTIQPEINRQRNLSRTNQSNRGISTNSKKSRKSTR